MGDCSVKGCGQPSRKQGWCAAHYAQTRRTGAPPVPFKRKWSERTPCVICGKPSIPGKRQFCSSRCQKLQSEPTTTCCNLCGDAVDLFETGRAGRKRRVDTLLCGSCRRSRKHRHKFAVKVLRNRDGSDCGICGEPVDFELAHPHSLSPSVDHIVPRGRGGSDEASNLQVAHLTCNQKKHARLLQEVAS